MLRSCVLALIIVGKLEVLCGRVMQKWGTNRNHGKQFVLQWAGHQWPPEKGHYIIAVAFHMMLKPTELST